MFVTAVCVLFHIKPCYFFVFIHFTVADLGEGSEEPFGLKKSQKEEKSAWQAKKGKKKIRAPSLAKGVDPPLICMTEALLANAVSCRMNSMQFS